MIETLKYYDLFEDQKLLSCRLLENQGYCNENHLLHSDKASYIIRKFKRTDIDRKFEFRVQALAYEKGNDLAEVLQTLHSIHIDAEPINLETLIESKTDEILRAFKTVKKYPSDYVLCHNDPNPRNILFADDIKLIDWEYAGVNDRYFDLASVCVEFGLSATEEAYFLKSYFADGSETNYEKHKAYKIIYKSLYEQWFEALKK